MLPKRRSSLERRYHSQRKAQHWHRRQRLMRVRLRLANRVFGIQHWGRMQQDQFTIFRTFLRAILPGIVLAVVIVIALEAVAFMLQLWIAPRLQDVAILRLLQLSSDAYSGLATGIVELTGAFLALYYAAVTVVASTVYADVEDDVRRLLVDEAFGNFYFRIVALLGVVAVLVAGMLVLGYVPSFLVLALLIMWAVFSILSFVVLGLKTLDFFNPTPLLNYLDRDFLRWSMAATPKGLLWHDQSFQFHYQQQAEKTLRTYQSVIAMVADKKAMGVHPVMEIARRTHELMVIYARTKQQVPTESYWFRRKGEFQDWLLADPIFINLALSTGTGIQQRSVPNLLWVEEELHEVLGRVIERLVSDQNWYNLALMINDWQNALAHISLHWGVQEAESSFFRLQRRLFNAVILPDDHWRPDAASHAQELGLRLAVLDTYQLAYVQIVLGFAKRVGDVKATNFGEQIEAIDWTKRQDIYQTHLPREIVKELEFLHNALQLEFAAEGSRISPAWYLQQWVATKFARYVVDTVQRLIQQIASLFVDESASLIDQGSLAFAAQTCTRGIEAVTKGRLCLKSAQHCLDELAAYSRPLGFHLINAKWPDVNWDALAHRLDETHERVLLVWAKALPTLMMLPKSEHLPDMFGQACTELAVGCFTAMAEGKEDLFKQLFLAYFLGALAASDRLFEELRERETWLQLSLGTDPILDVLEISGYALVYSELGVGDFWSAVKGHWDWLFKDPQEGQSRIEKFEALVSYRENQLVSTPHNLIRTGWKQAFGALMRDKGLDGDFTTQRYFGIPSKLEAYSPLIQVLLGRGMGGIPFWDLYSVFLAVYFDEDSPAPRFTLPRQASEFRRSLELHKERYPEEGSS